MPPAFDPVVTRREFLTATGRAAAGGTLAVISGAGVAAAAAAGRVPTGAAMAGGARASTLRLDHVTLAVRNLYEASHRLREETGLGFCDGGWTDAGLASRIFPLGGGVYLQVEGIVDACAVDDPSRPDARRFYKAVARGEHFRGFGLRVDTVEELGGAPARTPSIGEGWCHDGPRRYLYEDRSLHPSGRRVIAAANLVAPLGVAWIEVGGREVTMSSALGVPASQMGLRFNGGRPGVYAVAVRTWSGEVVLRRNPVA